MNTNNCWCRFAFGYAGGSWCAVNGGRLPSRMLDVSLHLGLHSITFLPVQTRIASARTPTTRQTRLLRGVPEAPRCSAKARLGQVFQYIKNRLYYDVSCCISTRAFLDSSLPHKHPQHATRSQEANRERSHKEFQVPGCLGSLKKSAHRKLSCLWRWIKD